MGTCTREDFSGLDNNPETSEATPISNFKIFLIKCQLWLSHGHLHAPRFSGTGQKSRHPRGHANFNFHDFFDQMPTQVVSWALAALIGFWELATKSGNPTPKNTDSPETRPISEHTLMQPRTSSSHIEWGTPSHPLTQMYILLVHISIVYTLVVIISCVYVS